jgi:hypothetical protein
MNHSLSLAPTPKEPPIEPDNLRPGLAVWAELPGLGWQPARIHYVGALRGERTKLIIVFETGRRQKSTRTPPYLRPRNLSKGGRDKPRPVLRSG